MLPKSASIGADKVVYKSLAADVKLISESNTTFLVGSWGCRRMYILEHGEGGPSAVEAWEMKTIIAEARQA